MPKLSYDNVTMLDNMTRQCDTVMSPDGHVDWVRAAREHFALQLAQKQSFDSLIVTPVDGIN